MLSLLRTRSDDDEAGDLAALTGAWAGEYDVGVENGTWRASCRYGIPLLLTGRTATELAARIHEDWVDRAGRGER